MALEHIDPYPWFVNKPLDLVVSEQLVRSKITATEWADHWRPFLGRLYDLWQANLPNRFIVAIAGPPGAGKSVLAEQLHYMIDKGVIHRDCHTVCLPMDGFHYPNAYLQSHTRHMSDGAEIPLSKVKGQPDTIDVPRLKRYIKALVDRLEYVPWPGYSRFTHDVVPDKFKVHKTINLVIIEGNYLLVDRGPFAGLANSFNLRIYVDAPGPKIIANLVERHILGGKSLDDAKDWVKRIDLPNARVAESTKPNADVVFERDAEDDIASVHWKGEESTVSSKESAPATESTATTAHLVTDAGHAPPPQHSPLVESRDAPHPPPLPVPPLHPGPH